MRRKASPEDRGRLSFWHRVEREARSKRRQDVRATKRLYPVAGALLRQYGGEGSFLPIGEVHPREFAELAGLHPGAARKIRGRLEGARLLTIGLEGWFLPFEEGQARHNIPRTVPLSTASPKKAAETRHTIPSKEGNAPLSTVTILFYKRRNKRDPG